MVEVVVRRKGRAVVVITERQLQEDADGVALRLGMEPQSDDAAAIIWRLSDDLAELRRLCGSWKEAGRRSRFVLSGD